MSVPIAMTEEKSRGAAVGAGAGEERSERSEVADMRSGPVLEAWSWEAAIRLGEG